LELAVQLLRMASQSGDPLQIQQGHFALGNTLFWQGEFAIARDHLERVRASYDPSCHEGHVAFFGEDAGVTSGSYLSWVLWFLGQTDEAEAVSERTVALARQLGHSLSLAYALTFAAVLQCRLRRPERARVLAEEILEVVSDHGFPLWQIGAALARGWASAMQGELDSLQTLRRCAEATRAAMGGVTLVVLEPLAAAHVLLGQFDVAAGVIDEAMAVAASIGDHHIDAELCRLKGESLLGRRNGKRADAAALFARALEISRRQQAASLELRAAASMAGLWVKEGRSGDARDLLQGVCRGIPEGSLSPDLRDARKLLDSLSRNAPGD
jgi:predicted ATPase